LLHTDAAQALAVLPLDVARFGVDVMSLSAHKVYGPKGIGALYLRRDMPLRPRPIIHGGGQEDGLRSGTLPTPLCVGFGKACEILASERAREVLRITALRDRLLSGLYAALPGIQLNGVMNPRHAGNLNVIFPGVESDLLLQRLQPRIAASTGAACTSGIPEPSHVLRAIGLSPDAVACSVRFSVGRFTTLDEVDAAVDAVREGIAGLA
jgi:cysteine desulfurase